MIYTYIIIYNEYIYIYICLDTPSYSHNMSSVKAKIASPWTIPSAVFSCFNVDGYFLLEST